MRRLIDALVPLGNVVMGIDSPYQTPSAESSEKLKLGEGRDSRRNRTHDSPEYNAAFKTAQLLQTVLAVVTALVLDFGQTHRAFWVAFLGQWAMVWIIRFRRPIHPTWFDLSLVRYGIVPLLFIVASAGPSFLRLLGLKP